MHPCTHATCELAAHLLGQLCAQLSYNPPSHGQLQLQRRHAVGQHITRRGNLGVRAVDLHSLAQFISVRFAVQFYDLLIVLIEDGPTWYLDPRVYLVRLKESQTAQDWIRRKRSQASMRLMI